jgi:iron complex outermembrane receptor protein
LGEVIVTAQKREQSLQDVPISLNSLGEQTLSELNVQNFKDYVLFLPSVTAQPSLGAGAGFSQVYMRGVATGGDGQATLSQPSVGTYLDEQPITTVQGNLDLHLYDIARVEALAGPQGTLYGASSQAGTIRIITNKPDPSGFASGYALEGNYVDMEEFGYVAEGFVNVPLGENAAVRLVGWSKSEAGWIDNHAVTRFYRGANLGPADNIGGIADEDDDFLADNSEFAEDNYNTADTIGARAALRINLGENWTLTPGVMYQKMEQEGAWGDDLRDVVVSGNNDVARFSDEFADDEWWQAGLTVEGSIGTLDVTYSGNYLSREFQSVFDYSDYSYWYDFAGPSGYFSVIYTDNDGNFIPRTHSYSNDDEYSRTSHELRITTAQDRRVRGLLGFFYQKQEHDFYQEFGRVDGLADFRLLNFNDPDPNAQLFPGIVYLNSMDREDTDQAVFGQVAFDITDAVEVSLGARYFEPEVTLMGFFGFPTGFINDPVTPWGSDGEVQCDAVSGDGTPGSGQQDRGNDQPCVNVDKRIKESDSVYRVNVTWKATDTAMLYATWSEGYRPGGVQRNPALPNYVSDFLTNYEIGWKTRFADDRLQLNGAIFLDEWDDIQIGFQGLNGITQVDNGPSAEIQGIEVQLDWLPTDNLRISSALAYYDSELKDDYCDDGNNNGQCDPAEAVNAPAGTALPVTPDFKANLIARYLFPLGGFEAHLQGAVAYQTSRASILNVEDNEIYGDIPSSTFLDLAFGVTNDKYSIELFLANATDEDAPLYVTSQCSPGVCGVQANGVTPRPQTVGIRFSQSF